MAKKMKTGMSIFLGIALAVVFIAVFNLGVGVLYPQTTQDYMAYQLILFYIFAVSGTMLAILGLFTKSLPFQIVWIASGMVLIFQAVISTWGDNKPMAFFASLIALGILGFLTYKKVNK